MVDKGSKVIVRRDRINDGWEMLNVNTGKSECTAATVTLENVCFLGSAVLVGTLVDWGKSIMPEECSVVVVENFKRRAVQEHVNEAKLVHCDADHNIHVDLGKEGQGIDRVKAAPRRIIG